MVTKGKGWVLNYSLSNGLFLKIKMFSVPQDEGWEVVEPLTEGWSQEEDFAEVP